MKTLWIACVSAMLCMACGKSTSHAPPPPVVTAPAPTVAAPAEPVKPALPTLVVHISAVGNTMTFDLKEINAQAGQTVTVILVNHSTMSTMAHNWVLIKPGTAASVAARGLKMGEQAGYVDVTDHDMLAHTPMAKAGETVEVTFTAPEEAGSYDYICSFPGHYLMMKGKFIVKS